MKGGGHLWNHFQAICCVLLCYFPQPSFQDCYSFAVGCGGHGCAGIFHNDPACICDLYENRELEIDCCQSITVFPIFSYYNEYPISYVTIYGTFTTIYEHAYYLLTTMTNTTVCLQQYSSQPTNLMTYEDTFATMSPNGIGALQFFYYNPTNLSIMSNSQNIPSLTIQKANLAIIPIDSINHLSALKYLDLSNNQLTNVPSNSFIGSSLVSVDLKNNQLNNVQSNAFSGSSLATIDVSFNQITKLATNAFQSTSSSPISFNAKNNSLTSLDYDAFNLSSASIYIDASNNKITEVDEEFSKWIQASTSFILNLSNNPLPCDSTVQWMATFACCRPIHIVMAGTELCPNGEPLFDYLLSYANCG